MRRTWSSIVLTAAMLIGLADPLTGGAEAAAAASDSSAVLAAAVPTRNVALNAAVQASGETKSSEAAKYAVDGRSDTKWADSSNAKIKWLKLDLGRVYTVNEWAIKNAGINEGNSPFWNTKNYRLQQSADGKTWSDVDVVQNNAQTIVDRYLPEPVTARYFRLYISQGAYDANVARVYELELYGVDAELDPAYPAGSLPAVDYVDPFINTLGDNGQTNPGPTAPFGLVSLGPDSDGGAFSGYYYQDKYLKGFSHLRFSGVGCSGAGGNILMMPETGDFTKDSGKYKQLYDKSSEQASAGYYAVNLNSGVGVELTASDNVGMHRYTFPESERDGSVLIDLSNSYAGMVDANLKVEGSNEISGMIQSQNVCGHGYYTIYYSIQFDRDFDSYQSWQGDSVGEVSSRSGSNSGAWLNFDTSSGRTVQAKVGLSAVSPEQAKIERDTDIKGWDFDGQRAKLKGEWSDVLGKVEIKDADETNKRVFYTQLYHSFLHPKNVTSSSGTFKAGRDENTIRQASELGENFEYYNGWTTWDDFRKYALFSVLEPQRYENMVKSLVDLYKTRGSYTQWGDGYWPSPTVRNEFNGAVILDAYAKGFRDFDVRAALKGMGTDADNFAISDTEISGKLEKAKSGYFPMKLAELTGDEAAYEKYKQTAAAYRDLWNANQVDEKGRKMGFFTPNGQTVEKSDVTAVDKYAYQGNLWTYRFSSTHDIRGMAELMGGKAEMAKQLQDFFARDEYLGVNETVLDTPYLFDYLGYPYLTQYYAREYTTEIVTQKYHNHGLYSYPLKSRIYRDDPEGYLQSMDDDAGAMSSWFVYSALGLFPGNPGDANFLIGSPIFSEVTLHLDNGKTFTIKADGSSSENRYIRSASLNGKNFDRAWIGYDDIMNGGALTFDMGSEPNTSWGARASSAPPTFDYGSEPGGTLVRAELMPMGSTWKYEDGGRDLGTAWTSVSYDDKSWKSGAAPLGYDNKKYAKTVLSFGGIESDKNPTAYFRKTFELSDVDGLLELEGGLVRDDGAVVYVNGNEVYRTNMPSGRIGYKTYANATVGDERSPVSFSVDPSVLAEGVNTIAIEIHQVNATSSDIALDLSLSALRQLDRPAAPTAPVVDDTANTFGWTAVPGIAEASAYEFTTDGGASWTTAASNPQIVGPAAYAAGKVQVRAKANAELNRAYGEALISDKAYTSDIRWDVFDLEADVKRGGNMQVSVQGTLKGAYSDSAVAVIQLMNGASQAFVSSAIPVETGSFDVSQTFNVNADKYRVNIYLVDDYNGNVYDSLWLADPIVSQPEPQPEPGGGEQPGTPGDPGNPSEPGEEPLPEPLPVPVKVIDVPEPAIEPDSPEANPNRIEFESYASLSAAAHPINGNKLKTEAGSSGTVVANTFGGAWLTYRDVNFGAEGANRIAIEYDAPSNKVPADAALEFRIGSETGRLVGTLPLKATGSGWGNYGKATALLSETITGVQNLTVVLRGTATSSLPYIGNFDRMDWSYEKIRADYAALELESYDQGSTDVNPANGQPLKTEAGNGGRQVAGTFNGAWLAYKAMNFGSAGADTFAVTYSGNSTNTAADSAVEVRLGSPQGERVGVVAAPPTAASWGTYKTASAGLTRKLTGVQDIYLVLTGTTDGTYKYIGNFDKAAFTLAGTGGSDTADPQPGGEEPGPGGSDPGTPQPNFSAVNGKLAIEFERYTSLTDAKHSNGNPLGTEKNNGDNIVVKDTFPGAWLAYARADFGADGMNVVEVTYDAPSQKAPADAALELRLGSAAGELIGTIKLPNTGGGWGSYKTVSAELSKRVSGVQDLYVVMRGATTGTLPYIGNFDRLAFSAGQ
ncbi:GH92 family glycosyl hydrolase [Saccharibacillus sp. CPCC 101409]|uniref:GH92 family glycosyl hydrolase n=1 Tax=Saccharibacillus sp. CPCC 101409 TaxID=3058041 RepID=UPI002672227D|nr:GH92 family glycosyl hydrolase [Saccharibacillus sp. CPCC 101409]MDO3412604.1 GH92 family glycosyl hydrolase [Saccharibacillus sp. CPCC 101409]